MTFTYQPSHLPNVDETEICPYSNNVFIAKKAKTFKTVRKKGKWLKVEVLLSSLRGRSASILKIAVRYYIETSRLISSSIFSRGLPPPFND